VKLIVAVIKPFKLDDVKAALTEAGLQGLTVSEVRVSAASEDTEVYRGAEYTVDFVPKVKVEILVRDEDAEAIATRLMDAARTGKIGDGKIWIVPIDSVFRIRTGEAAPARSEGVRAGARRSGSRPDQGHKTLPFTGSLIRPIHEM
jgi:nitrogen regulatory protein P-II 1